MEPRPNTMWPGPRSTSVPSSVFIYPAVWPQQTWDENWGLCPFFWEEGEIWVPIEHNAAWAEVYLHTKWHLDPPSRLTTIHGPKSGRGAAVPLWGREMGPHLTQLSPWPRPISVPSGILIQPPV